ncbi:MAG TPA: hypothetical protein VH280_18440 [Verrucomicrobiae bacterium]|jgi:DNA repair exonuclease SbcCD ATPase subunit|nr:hypothetical protein [Verrucomicrobiae bacterium]
MQNAFKEVVEQIKEIRNLLGPIDLKLDKLDDKITAERLSFEAKAADLYSMIADSALKIDKQWEKISEHSDELAEQSARLNRIESLLKSRLP